MGFESLLLIVVVVEAVWILSSLFRGSDDDRKGVQRRPLARDGESPNPRQRPPVTNVDRFLEEINRRRREAAERQAGTARPESPPRPRPSPSRQEEPPRRRPGSAPVVVAAQPVPAAVVVGQPQLETAREKRRSQAEPLEVELDKPAPAQAAPVAAAQSFTPTAPTTLPPAKRLTSSTQTQTRRASPLLDQLLPLLRDRKSLPVALVLHEIFGQPLSRRSPRSRRKIG
jgi:hypothetical protein